MSFKEIIEIAKKRGLQAGKAKRADIVKAFQSGTTYTGEDISINVNGSD
jgi:hypothetical protein